MTAGMAAGCTQAPVTGRNQLILIDEGQANQLGAEAWQQINSEMKVSSDKAARARVQQIGERVAAASGAEGVDWERSEEQPAELQALMRRAYAGFCLKKK